MALQTQSAQPLNPIGIGTWNISSDIDRSKAHELYKGTYSVYGNEKAEIAALRHSLDSGQNHIDCAELYGAFYTDEVVGRAIAGYVREDLFIADKLWKLSVTEGKVRPTVEQMLTKLGTDYIDLLYIHVPWEDTPWQEAIPQIDELIDQGVVRYFGVSNFTVEDMEETMRIAKHPIAANQMNFNVLYKDEVSQPFIDFCRQHDIQIVAYQPIKRKEVLENETVQAIAAAQDATPAQVALAWLIHRGALTIPKATTTEHIDDNFKAIDLKLSDEQMTKLTAL